MSFFVHTLEYKGGPVISDISPRNYKATDYNQYKYKYENSFYPMRNMLGLPRECCKTSDELLKNRDNIFVLEDNGEIIGSVAIYSNEIDDLFVANEYQQKGVGLKLLRYALAFMQKKNEDRIIIHVAGVNKYALLMYLKAGFVILGTEEIYIWIYTY